MLGILVKVLLSLRYRVRVAGLRAVARRGRKGILFLPNHPALIDPVILMSYLLGPFAPRALADKDQIDRFFIRWLAARIGALPIPDMSQYGPAAREKVREALAQCAEALRDGQNLLLYPAGRVYRGRTESIGASRSAERLLRLAPDVRVVLMRTTGLWGSGFGWAGGREPDLGAVLRKAAWALLTNALFLSPRREVTIELHEPEDLPRDADRATLNRFLETFYNRDAPPNTYVPYSIWEAGGTRTLPEPTRRRSTGDPSAIPEKIRREVLDFLGELAGVSEIEDASRLANDLGLDSIGATEVGVWVEEHFAVGQVDVESLQTVGDMMLAAAGQAGGAVGGLLRPIPRRWFVEDSPPRRVGPPSGRTVAEMFLHQARKTPGKIAFADQASGALSYRTVVTGILLLRRGIAALPGERVGIMLPASGGAGVVYLATLFAGKTPVLVNWTVGPRNMRHCLELAGVERVLTVERLISRIESQGTDLGLLEDRFLPLKTLRKGAGLFRRLRAGAMGRLCWRELDKANISETAAVLFTSGSETAPKAVPLSQANVTANLRDLPEVVSLRSNDRLLGFLPPFHSFGLTGTMLAPLCLGLSVVYHPNPTEGAVLARLIEAYRPTVVMGTPTFLGGIARAATADQLSSLRLLVTGAEKCSDHVYDALADRCPEAVVAEGYGVTECSPVVSLNDDREPRRGTIGKVLPSVTHAIVDEDAGARVAPGQTGMLLVRGPSVFGGYLGGEAPSPFVDFEGHAWYRTGDLVSEDDEGVLTFRGRRKRFVKVAGEMISLPMIEAILAEHYQPADSEAPTIAVEAARGRERPELTLFAVEGLDREAVNAKLREAGLSPLHNIRAVVRLEEIPLLGTGKTDYRKLREQLETPPG